MTLLGEALAFQLIDQYMWCHICCEELDTGPTWILSQIVGKSMLIKHQGKCMLSFKTQDMVLKHVIFQVSKVDLGFRF